MVGIAAMEFAYGKPGDPHTMGGTFGKPDSNIVLSSIVDYDATLTMQGMVRLKSARLVDPSPVILRQDMTLTFLHYQILQSLRPHRR